MLRVKRAVAIAAVSAGLAAGTGTVWAVTSSGHSAAKVGNTSSSSGNAGTSISAEAAQSSKAVSDILKPGEVLKPGQYRRSANRAHVLLMQPDGNLVLYKGKTALWSTLTAGHRGAFAVMQADGNFVVYAKPGKALWSANEGAYRGAHLAVQNDGNLVIYAKSGQAVWWRNVYIGSLRPGYTLQPGQAVLSPNRLYFLLMQKDGNLVLYKGSVLDAKPKKALWSTATSSPGAFAVMQTDGNFVVYAKPGKPIWGANPPGHTGARLEVQNDGNVVIYDSANKPVWWRGVYIGKLPSGYVLGTDTAATTVVSPNMQYFLTMQKEGNLVLYKGSVLDANPKKALWTSPTAGHPGAFAIMQAQGNLVIYAKPGQPLWATPTLTPGAFLDVQNDGNAVIYSPSNQPLWSTNTHG